MKYRYPYLFVSTGALVVSVVAIVFLCSHSLPLQSPTPETNSAETLMLTCMKNTGWMTEKQAEAIVRHAMRHESAVIFCHADWHSSSLVARPNFARLAAAYHRTYPEQKIGFHYLNLTEVRSKPLLLIPNLKERPLVASSYLTWLRDGQLTSARFMEINEDIDQLVKTTRSFTKRGGDNNAG